MSAALLVAAAAFAYASTLASGRQSTLLLAGAVFLVARPLLNAGHFAQRLVSRIGE